MARMVVDLGERDGAASRIAFECLARRSGSASPCRSTGLTSRRLAASRRVQASNWAAGSPASTWICSRIGAPIEFKALKESYAKDPKSSTSTSSANASSKSWIRIRTNRSLCTPLLQAL